MNFQSLSRTRLFSPLAGGTNFSLIISHPLWSYRHRTGGRYFTSQYARGCPGLHYCHRVRSSPQLCHHYCSLLHPGECLHPYPVDSFYLRHGKEITSTFEGLHVYNLSYGEFVHSLVLGSVGIYSPNSDRNSKLVYNGQELLHPELIIERTPS